MSLNRQNKFPRYSRWFHWIKGVAAILVLASGPVAFEAGASVVANVPAEAKAPTSILDSAKGVGSWIWDATATDKQTCRFWKDFEVPHSAVARASLHITVDNGYRLFLDGREIGRGSDWRTLTEYDLTWLLNPGKHILAVEAFNDVREGGLIMGLRIELVDQRVIEVASDKSWRVVPLSEEEDWKSRKQPGANWPPAKFIAVIGTHPWDKWPINEITLPTLRPVTQHFWQTGGFQIALLVTCGAAVLICVQLLARLAVQSRAQRFLQLERARIARDIHDDLGARLTQLVLLGEVARSELPDGSESRAQIDQVCDRARDLSHAMDEVVWAVNSRRDTLRDFVSYVCKYAQMYLAATPIRCRLDVEQDIPAAAAFDLPVRRNLFLAVKEALNNAAKHSGAAELFLRIQRRGGRLSVVVEDDGRGFDPGSTSGERNGMINMFQRMSEVAGQCVVTSEPGKGCRIEFLVPLTRESRLLRWFGKRRPSVDTAIEMSSTSVRAEQSGSIQSHTP